MNSSGSVPASAMIRKSMPRPRFDSRITGRRPKWSDSAPWIGEQKNCITMKAVANSPCHNVACAMSPPANDFSSCGSTGMIIPNARMSSSTVKKMKASAARRTGGAGASTRGSGKRGRAV